MSRTPAAPLPTLRGHWPGTGDGRSLGGTVNQWIGELTGAMLDHGTSGFIHRGPANAPTATALTRWAQEIVPAVREAVARA